VTPPRAKEGPAGENPNAPQKFASGNWNTVYDRRISSRFWSSTVRAKSSMAAFNAALSSDALTVPRYSPWAHSLIRSH
jgi:hypothetical protein